VLREKDVTLEMYLMTLIAINLAGDNEGYTQCSAEMRYRIVTRETKTAIRCFGRYSGWIDVNVAHAKFLGLVNSFMVKQEHIFLVRDIEWGELRIDERQDIAAGVRLFASRGGKVMEELKKIVIDPQLTNNQEFALTMKRWSMMYFFVNDRVIRYTTLKCSMTQYSEKIQVDLDINIARAKSMQDTIFSTFILCLIRDGTTHKKMVEDYTNIC